MDIATGKIYSLPPDSYPMRRVGVKKRKKKIIDLGCGENKYKSDEGEVIGCDIREEVKPDYRIDLHILPFETNQFDIVYSSHTLEHFGRDEVESVLDEWVRILKPGGEFRLVIPNIAWAAEQIVAGNMSFDVLNVLYGQQEYKTNFHKMGFIPQMIEDMFRARGLTIKARRLDGYNIILVAVKNREITDKKPNKKKRKTQKQIGPGHVDGGACEAE